MSFDTIKKDYWKKIAIVLGVLVVILLVLNFKGTRAKYSTSESVPLTRGTVNYKVYDFKIMAMYQENDSGEYDEVEVMPTCGYIINEEKSYCYTKTQEEHDDTVVLRTDSEWNHEFGNLKKNSKCYLWFDVKPITCNGSACETIMANKTVSTRTSFSAVVTASSTGTMYRADDDDGESYYFAGAATDNYVYFANKYWRIIRVNGDGTIRMIYDGTSARENGTSSTDTQTETSAFNSSVDDNAYVGFMYGTVGSSTYAATHANTNNSTIKGKLDTWYTNNLSSYASYIDTNAGFCGDRTSTTSSSGAPDGTGGTGITFTYYGAYYRLNTNKTPSLKCTNSSDLYTVSGASKGNKSLTNPIGLISADEVSYAGGVNGADNTSYYLRTEQHYWTMSPARFGGSNAYAFFVSANGNLFITGVSQVYGVIPVINLKSDVTLSGDGTAENAYKIS